MIQLIRYMPTPESLSLSFRRPKELLLQRQSNCLMGSQVPDEVDGVRQDAVGPFNLVHCFWCWIFFWFFYLNSMFLTFGDHLLNNPSLYLKSCAGISNDQGWTSRLAYLLWIAGSKIIEDAVEHKNGYCLDRDEVWGWTSLIDTVAAFLRAPPIFSCVFLLCAFSFTFHTWDSPLILL